VQNAAARLVSGARRHDHITVWSVSVPMTLSDLERLPNFPAVLHTHACTNGGDQILLGNLFGKGSCFRGPPRLTTRGRHGSQ